jgi:hypothetical protein
MAFIYTIFLNSVPTTLYYHNDVSISAVQGSNLFILRIIGERRVYTMWAICRDFSTINLEVDLFTTVF